MNYYLAQVHNYSILVSNAVFFKEKKFNAVCLLNKNISKKKWTLGKRHFLEQLELANFLKEIKLQKEKQPLDLIDIRGKLENPSGTNFSAVNFEGCCLKNGFVFILQELHKIYKDLYQQKEAHQHHTHSN